MGLATRAGAQEPPPAPPQPEAKPEPKADAKPEPKPEAQPPKEGVQAEGNAGVATVKAPDAKDEDEGEPPLAGNHGGVFYLRDKHDNFRLHVQGRMQLDGYTYFGAGVSDSALKATMLVRRLRPELTGEFLKHWQWHLAGDWGTTAFDNAAGNTETRAANPGKAPDATTGRYASAQTASIKAAVADAYINYRAAPGANVQLGQFDAPFTMENRTSDKYIPFMERSLAVRDLGIPTNKEIGLMLWGDTVKKHFSYHLGAFLGDGQNRPNADNRLDAMARIVVHPLASMEGEIKDLHIGASVRVGSRDPKSVEYDYATMSTQGAYTFWSSIYAGSKGQTHILPAGTQTGFGAELRVPVSMVDLTSEFVYVSNGTREAVEGFQPTNSERFGDLSGYSYYIMAGVWPLGHRDINGLPGYENPTHIDFKKPDKEDWPFALQLLAKWEQLNVTYTSASKSGTPDPANVDGSIKVNAFSLGANAWFTKHVRLSVNYVFNMFPGSAPVKATTAGAPQQTADQRALAPGNQLAAGVNDDARNNANALHELLFRAAIAL